MRSSHSSITGRTFSRANFFVSLSCLSQEYCQGWHSRSLFQATSDIQQRIDRLHHDIDYYRSNPAQKEKRALLCGYYTIFSDIALNHTNFARAIALLSHAIEIAEQEQFYDLWCYTLRLRGWVYRSRGEITALIQGNAAAQPDFQQALLNYQQAQQLDAKKVPDVYRGLVALASGSTSAAAGLKIDEALNIVDVGSKQVGKQLASSRIPISAILDEERYHLDRAYTYLSYPIWSAHHAKMARVELNKANEKAIHSLSRDTFSATLLAKSYLIEGRYGLATYHVREAMQMVQATASGMNLARLTAIYRALRNSEYGESDDVATLGVDLLKAQQPTLFK
ncbi:MAG: hypothetical protein E6J34_05055 [Chloroflexi bacterium]|nr:MAG: hypothetical protein E6J34_05055 [Chloroflexota bacterium]